MDFISEYLNYVGETETPMVYHRWCCLSMLGAFVGRDLHLKFGHSTICPNLYIMLIGTPGARKSTAIKIAKKVITLAGYNKISADRTSKEKFLLDLAGDDMSDLANVAKLDSLDANLWGDVAEEQKEMYIACDEFNDFIGTGNVEFISMLGSLWDFEGIYENRIKNGRSVAINNPTVSIIGGNTPVNFARAFPADILGQGFFSRLLLIHGESTGKRITFPATPSDAETAEIITALQRVKATAGTIGGCEISNSGRKLLDKVYRTWKPIDDTRFESYSNRRLSHLLKLCLVVCAAREGKEISEEDIIKANTFLHHAETFMPKAIGEFGKSKNSDISHKIMQLLETADAPMTITNLWEFLHKDLERINDLAELVRNLVAAGKVFSVGGGLLPKKKEHQEIETDTLDWNFLTKEEREMTI